MLTPLIRAIRSLRHRPAYAVIAVLLLTCGVAAAGAIFSVVDVALLRPLPYPESGRLVWLTAREPTTGRVESRAGLVPLQLRRWRSDNQAFEALEGAMGGSATLVGEDGTPEAVPGLAVSAGFLPLLGGAPARGRGFTRGEELATSTVAIVSDDFWRRRLGGRADVLGRSITLDGVPRTIVGVMPRGFAVFFSRTDVLVPLALDATQMASRYRAIMTVARLKPGTTIAQAATDLDRINDGIGREVALFQGIRAGVEPLRETLFGPQRGPLLILVEAVVLLAVIAGANIANLMLGDGLARRHATATRLALGASRTRILGLRLREALIIAIAGGAAGLAAGRAALAVLRAVNPSFFDGFGDLSLDARSVVAAGMVAAVVGVLAALPAGIAESRLSLTTLVSGAGRGVGTRADHRLREVLVGGQVALALVLLLAAALLARNLRALNTAPQGFEPRGLLAVKLVPGRTSPEERAVYLERLVAAVGSLPGVVGASASQSEFALDASSRTFLAIQGVPLADSAGQISNIRHVMPDAFRVMGMRLREGRALDERDRAGAAPVAVVNVSFARDYLAGHPLGARLRRTAKATLPWMTVVGVVDDVKDAGLGVDLGPTVYIPFLQESEGVTGMAVLARLSRATAPTERSVQRAIWSVDPTQSIGRIVMVEDLERESAAEPRFQALVVALFGTSAGALVIGGIYALTLFSVLRRRREFGVRAALGAGPRVLIADAAWRGLRPVAFGMVAGLLLAVPALVLLGRALGQAITVADVPLFVGVLVCLVVGTLGAAVLPAGRATRVSPVVAMQG